MTDGVGGAMPVAVVPLPMQGNEPCLSSARALAEALGTIVVPFVYVAPPGFVPLPQGLAQTIALLRRRPRAVSVRGAVIAHQAPTSGADGSADDLEYHTWQIAFSPAAIGEKRASRRLHNAANRYRPFTAAVHRTAALKQAASLVATAAPGDGFSEELLITLALALAGQVLDLSHVSIAIGPRSSFDHYGRLANLYGRVLSRAWFDRMTPILRSLAAELEARDTFLSLSDIRARLRTLVAGRRGAESASSAADEAIRNALGDAFFTLMAGNLVTPLPPDSGIGDLEDRFRRNPDRTPPVEQLQQNIEDYWSLRMGARVEAGDGPARRRA